MASYINFFLFLLAPSTSFLARDWSAYLPLYVFLFFFLSVCISLYNIHHSITVLKQIVHVLQIVLVVSFRLNSFGDGYSFFRSWLFKNR